MRRRWLRGRRPRSPQQRVCSCPHRLRARRAALTLPVLEVVATRCSGTCSPWAAAALQPRQQNFQPHSCQLQQSFQLLLTHWLAAAAEHQPCRMQDQVRRCGLLDGGSLGMLEQSTRGAKEPMNISKLQPAAWQAARRRASNNHAGAFGDATSLPGVPRGFPLLLAAPLLAAGRARGPLQRRLVALSCCSSRPRCLERRGWGWGPLRRRLSR